MSDSQPDIDALLSEHRVFEPPPAFTERALVSDRSIYERAEADHEAFWAEQAERLTWFKRWDTVMEWTPPWVKWFVGGQLNASYNCLDRHVEAGGGDKIAYHWEGEPGDTRTITYKDLYDETRRFANGLKSIGVRKGDRVAIYLGMVPELPVAMLACARIGAAHSVVFGGFSAESLKDRINDAEAKVLITADGSYRRGAVVPLKQNAEDALAGGCPSIEHVVTVRRTGGEHPFTPGRDLWYHELIADQPLDCEPEPMDAEDLLYLLYTSGTTGKPKGIAHTTGGYMTQVAATHRLIFDIHEDDVYWCAADIGWVTGHSYIVYGPLANHTTGIIYEGAPDWPAKDRLWTIAEKYGATILYTAPTAIRAFMRWGTEFPLQHDLSSLRLLGSVGEPINPEAWIWYWKFIGGERCPVVDTWWQTETGAILITPLPGVTQLKPGSATNPFPGIVADIVDEAGNSVAVGGGYLVLKRPWPAISRTIWGDPDRYVETYFSKYGPATYVAGDGAKRDEDGYYWLLGRIDDVMNVAGHRLSTYEIESALVDDPKVAEAAVVSRPDDLVGEAIVAYVTLKSGFVGDDTMAEELRDHVAKVIGKIARPHGIIFTDDLPKTRSGKIMRRLLRDVARGRPLGDVTTLANAEIVEQIRGMAGSTAGDE
jgi:acetyl-CoA synthetase